MSEKWIIDHGVIERGIMQQRKTRTKVGNIFYTGKNWKCGRKREPFLDWHPQLWEKWWNPISKYLGLGRLRCSLFIRMGVTMDLCALVLVSRHGSKSWRMISSHCFSFLGEKGKKEAGQISGRKGKRSDSRSKNIITINYFW